MKKLIVLLMVGVVALGAMPASAAPGHPGRKAVAIHHLKQANHRLHQKVKRLHHRLQAKRLGKHAGKNT